MIRFPLDVVAQHIRKRHPGCPEFAVEFFSREASGKEWTPGVKLGRAVGIVMDGLLRHHMTEYETLLLHGMDREEARRRVQPRIDAIIKAWQRPAVLSTSGDKVVGLNKTPST